MRGWKTVAAFASMVARADPRRHEQRGRRLKAALENTQRKINVTSMKRFGTADEVPTRCSGCSAISLLTSRV
jgi:hypothetical protein